MAKSDLTAARLRELLRYDPETGDFFRLVALRGGKLGVVPRTTSGNGYIYISVDGGKYLAHRLAWFWAHGEWPAEDIDHINCVRSDNRLANLRSVPRFVNNQNRSSVRSDNKYSGIAGVSWHKHCAKWRARITLHGVETQIGVYPTKEEASAAYIAEKRRLHIGCTI